MGKISVENVRIEDIAPDYLTQDANCLACMGAIDVYLRGIAEAAEIPALIKRMDKLNGEQLDHLARYFDADPWRDEWSEDEKRSVLRSVIEIKRHAGTLYAVKAALRSLGCASTVVEWWEKSPKGTPHTFEVNVQMEDAEGEGFVERQETVIKLIENAKPARSQFELVIKGSMEGGCATHAYMRTVSVKRLRN